MRVEDLLQRMFSLLLIYEVYMYSTTQSWKKGVVHQVLEHPDVKQFMSRIND